MLKHNFKLQLYKWDSVTRFEFEMQFRHSQVKSGGRGSGFVEEGSSGAKRCGAGEGWSAGVLERRSGGEQINMPRVVVKIWAHKFNGWSTTEEPGTPGFCLASGGIIFQNSKVGLKKYFHIGPIQILCCFATGVIHSLSQMHLLLGRRTCFVFCCQMLFESFFGDHEHVSHSYFTCFSFF